MAEFLVEKKNGSFRNLKAWKQYTIDAPNGKYKITIDPIDKRSTDQNSYLHGILIPEFRKALNSVGYGSVKTNDQAKLIMKKMFLTDTLDGFEYVKDTSSLTTVEMSALFEEVVQFCAENMNYTIALPNEQLTIDTK